MGTASRKTWDQIRLDRTLLRLMGGRKLLVINQYYAPDVASTGQLAAELCEGLAQRGFEVCVITGQPSYSSQSPKASPFEERNSVRVYRVPIRLKGRERFINRILGYLQFLWGAWWRAKHLVRKEGFDTVLTFHNPPFVGWIGARLATRYRLRFVYALYDIHPDVLLATGWKLPRPIVKAWEALHRYILDKADTVIVLGEAMKETLERKGVLPEGIKVIPPWARPELQPLPRDQVAHVRKELGIDKEVLLLLYAGNMGVMHPLDPLLEAALALKGKPVHFLFLGEGVRRAPMMAKAESEGLNNVAFLPYQPEDRFAQIVGASDACFVVLQPGLEHLALPCRAFTFLSAGRPLVTFMSPEAELARLVEEMGCGWNVTSAEELVGLVHRLLADPEESVKKSAAAQEVYRRMFLREDILDRYAEILKGHRVGGLPVAH